MLISRLVSASLVFCSLCLAQGRPGSTSRISTVNSLPASCSLGDVYVLLTGSSKGLYFCGPNVNSYTYAGAVGGITVCAPSALLNNGIAVGNGTTCLTTPGALLDSSNNLSGLNSLSTSGGASGGLILYDPTGLIPVSLIHNGSDQVEIDGSNGNPVITFTDVASPIGSWSFAVTATLNTLKTTGGGMKFWSATGNLGFGSTAGAGTDAVTISTPASTKNSIQLTAAASGAAPVVTAVSSDSEVLPLVLRGTTAAAGVQIGPYGGTPEPFSAGPTSVTRLGGSAVTTCNITGSNLGTGGSPACTVSANSTNLGGIVTITTGHASVGTSVELVQIVLGTTYAAVPACLFTPASLAAKSLALTTSPYFNYAQSSTTVMSIYASGTALAIDTTYLFFFGCPTK